MIYLAEFILVGPVTVGMAYWHSRLIKANRPIKHGWWASLYASLLLIASLLLQKQLPEWHILIFAVACLIGRLVVFNISLNVLRSLSWDYTSPTTTSILDKIERRLFGSRVWLAEVVLGVTFIFLQFFLR